MKKFLKKAVAGFAAAALGFGSAGILPEGIFEGFNITASAESGTCGPNLTWTLENDTLTIRGTGGMYAYEDNVPPWAYKEFKNLIIEHGVTSISTNAFNSCRNLINIEIPISVTDIPSAAFKYCSSLESISLPISIKSIGEYAFAYCSSLESITLPNRITKIGNFAFAYSGLRSTPREI